MYAYCQLLVNATISTALNFVLSTHNKHNVSSQVHKLNTPLKNCSDYPNAFSEKKIKKMITNSEWKWIVMRKCFLVFLSISILVYNWIGLEHFVSRVHDLEVIRTSLCIQQYNFSSFQYFSSLSYHRLFAISGRWSVLVGGDDARSVRRTNEKSKTFD